GRAEVTDAAKERGERAMTPRVGGRCPAFARHARQERSSMTPTPASPLPALARDGIDRAAGERSTPRLVERLRADPATRVLCVHGDRAPLLADGRLHTVAPGDVAGHAEWGFLGRTPEGDGVLVAACDVLADPPIAAERWE